MKTIKTTGHDNVSRINKVMEYVIQNLDEKLSSQKLAEIANFSVRNFHRVFSKTTGETLGKFIKRVRLEKAAWLLLNEKQMSISDICYACGFDDTSLFTYSFRTHFSIPPTEYRLQKKKTSIKSKTKIGKNTIEIGKNTILKLDNNPELCNFKNEEVNFINAKIEIKEMENMNVVYVQRIDQYTPTSRAYENYMKLLREKGLVKFRNPKSLYIYQDDSKVPNNTVIIVG
jgi:AraC family transcriptional regulator